MKKLSVIILVALLAAALTVPALAAPAFANGNFAGGADGWMEWDNPVYTFIEAPPGVAGQALETKGNGGWVGWLYTNLTGLEPDKTYEVTFYAMVGEDRGYARAACIVEIRGGPENGFYIGPDPYYDVIPTTDEWYKVSLSFTTPAEFDNIRFTIQFSDCDATYAGFSVAEIDKEYTEFRFALYETPGASPPSSTSPGSPKTGDPAIISLAVTGLAAGAGGFTLLKKRAR